MLRRALGYHISVEALIEVALWLAIPHITIGVIWAFLHPSQVQHYQIQLEPLVPAGADLIAFGLTAGLWPFLLIAPLICG
ncbi:MAG: hypothetical protein U0R18_13955 [Mycobacterium sp.]